ncbi:BTB domain containing protein [Pyrenophora tritici-repentis]|uniref:BTB domain containing protein n=2 Tax=Pyrenophora tritici-repentis TaxID=45151 RepID=A0A2W1EG51_9PLEO|nr:uncharacterized protein PTRG_04797 [Pyrenophora tritici-repentis Pt-1C-BFP]KAA8612426.1 BTB domain-containing protein [Pyrenophora tritici-repentis]EDU47704.1 predicted protein [Pyrenophora tritici-repentis Pt-1C-BFP]KAF7447047.1 BTB domain containing protein [Pyrenophora tritici-repentis]KAF7569338.1 BTB domain containing protein [Pyrenophora tritici-repentis]KAG9382889.1 BTB domain containing protein [Pyrenophora tritici-repentis]
MGSSTIYVEPMLCRWPPTKPLPTAYGEPVAIISLDKVKGKKMVLRIYRGVLSHYAPVFGKLVEPEGVSEDTIYLKDVSSDTFSIFIDWVNTSNIYIPSLALDDTWQSFIDAHEFAKVYGIQDFENRVLDAFYSTLSKAPYISFHAMTIVYNGTDGTS